MSESGSRLSSLDQLGIDILTALVDHDGEADSTALRKYLGLSDDSARSRFNYRVTEYLEPEGLIETHQPDPEPGKYPPKILMLTKEGQELLEDLNSESASSGIADRLQRLEEQVDGFRQENQKLREENRELKELIEESGVEAVTNRVTELTENVDRLQAKMSNMRDTIEETQTHPLIQSTETAEGFDTMLVTMNACRRIIEEEIKDGEERVKQERADVRETLSERGRLLTND
jgi:prefoldin subunit 5